MPVPKRNKPSLNRHTDHPIIIFEKSPTPVCSFCDNTWRVSRSALIRFNSLRQSVHALLALARPVDCGMFFVKLE